MQWRTPQHKISADLADVGAVAEHLNQLIIPRKMIRIQRHGHGMHADRVAAGAFLDAVEHVFINPRAGASPRIIFHHFLLHTTFSIQYRQPGFSEQWGRTSHPLRSIPLDLRYTGDMPSGENLDAFMRLPLFEGLAADTLKLILDQSHLRNAGEGEAYFYQDDPANHLYLLKLGRVRLSQVTQEGQQVIHNVIGPGEMFGLVGLVANGKYPVSATAAAESQAYSWETAAMTRLAERFPRLALNAMGMMAARVNEFQGQIRALATERVERRLARSLLRLVRQVGKKSDRGVLIDLSLSRQDLAEMSGTTLFTASRILSQWERMGLLEAGRERLVILNPHGLVQIAEDLPPYGEGEGSRTMPK